MVGRTEEDDLVAFAAGDVGDVEEAHVHAHRADDGHLAAVDDDAAVAIAEMAVETVGIPYGDDGDACGTLGNKAAVVAYAVALRDVLDLRDARLEGADGLEVALDGGLRRDAVKADTETHHIHLRLGETLDARRVEYVAEDAGGVDGVAEGGAPAGEAVDLGAGVGVLRGVVGTGEVGEDGLDTQGTSGSVEQACKLVEVALGKAETVHPCVEFDMHGKGFGTPHEVGGFGEEVEDAERVDVGFETVAYDVVEALLLGIHDHDGEGDAVAAEVDALVGIGDGEVVGATVLEGGGHFDLSGTVAGGFDHRHEARGGSDKRAVVVEVGDEVVEVDLHHRLVRAAAEHAGDVLEMEAAGPLEEDGFAVEEIKIELLYALFGGLEEMGVEPREKGLMAAEGFANADEAGDAVMGDELRHLRVEVGLGNARLENIAHDKGLAGMLAVVGDIVECDGQGVEVEAVGVVDEERRVEGFVHLETHGDGRKAQAPLRDGLGIVAEIAEEGDAVERVLDGGTVGEGDGEVERLTRTEERKAGVVVADVDAEDLDGVAVGVAPGEAADGAEAFELRDGGMDFLVVGGIDEGVAVGEELQLLGNLLLAGEEVLVVCLSDVGEDADGGVDDSAEVLHLASLGDASFEDGELVGFVHLPYGEGDTDLRVVAAGRGDGFAVFGHQLEYPVFDNGLAVGTGDAHHGDVEKAAAVSSKQLEGGDDILDVPEVGSATLGELRRIRLGSVGRDDKVAHTAFVEVLHIAAAGVALGGYGKEKAARKVGRATAVGEKARDVAGVVGNDGCGAFEYGCDF